MNTTLYRLFDASGHLLYIGIAGNPGRRFEQHAREKAWWGNVSNVTLEHFPAREDAALAEMVAIGVEHPVHNIIGNKGNVEASRGDPVSNNSERSDRLGQAADAPLNPASLIGSFFLAGPNPGWQGCVVAEPSPGWYLVELFSWVMGESTNQHLVRIETMATWEFFDSAEWMTNAYEHGVATLWQRARDQAKANAEL